MWFVCVGTSTEPSWLLSLCGTFGLISLGLPCAYTVYCMRVGDWVCQLCVAVGMCSSATTGGCRVILSRLLSISPPPRRSSFPALFVLPEETLSKITREAGLSPARTSEGLKTVWTEANVTGHEAIFLLCVSMRVLLCLCLFGLGNSMSGHAHILLPHKKMKPYVSWWSTWEHMLLLLRQTALGKSLATEMPTAAKTHTEPQVAFSWVIS